VSWAPQPRPLFRVSALVPIRHLSRLLPLLGLLAAACSPAQPGAVSATPRAFAATLPSAAPAAPPSIEAHLTPPPPEKPRVLAPTLLFREPTDWVSVEKNPLRRVEEANKKKLAEVKGLFAAARVSFPPSQMLLRAFKRERVLEVWAASRPGDSLSLVASYGVCAASGELGPKRVEGDEQVPEGLYKIKDTLPATPFYLALHVDYPNIADRILGDKRRPGSEILIHGSCASVGCLSMTDERAAEIYVAASAYRSAGGSLDLHIFPARDMAALLAAPESAPHRPFWENLRPFLETFERTHRVPRSRVGQDGRYLLVP
jgi:murein L,D-transpeptidase YafK